MLKQSNSLKTNLNRLVLVTTVLLALKAFTYFFESFLPLFSKLLSNFVGALFPFIIALLLAFLLEPAVRRICAHGRIKRGYAALIALLGVYGILGLLIFALLNRLHTELVNLSLAFPSYNQIVTYLSAQIQLVQHYINLNPKVRDVVFNSTQDIFSHLQSWASYSSVLLLKAAAALPGTFAVVLVAIIATYFFSADFPRVKSFFQSLFPRKWKGNVRLVSLELGSALYGFLRAEATLIGITMVLTTTGLLLLGLSYAFTVGVLSGLLDLLPVVGTASLYVPWVIWSLITGKVAFGIKLAIMWVIAVAVRQILEPKLLSKSIGLDPLPTLISMYVGLKLFGGWGLLLGPSIIVVFQALHRAGVFHFPRE